MADTVIRWLDSGWLGWPTDDAVVDQFRTRSFYGSVAQSRIRLVLGAIDDRLRADDPHQPAAQFRFDELQIEHVMPRAWSEHWPVTADGATPLADDDMRFEHFSSERNRAVNRIGNLTLVTPSFNRDVSNLGWSVKNAEFKKQRGLMVNFDVADAESWNEEHIDKRAALLAAAAIRIWPAPEGLWSVPGGEAARHRAE